jgi:hypothetical protein
MDARLTSNITTLGLNNLQINHINNSVKEKTV